VQSQKPKKLIKINASKLKETKNQRGTSEKKGSVNQNVLAGKHEEILKK
jgi:hypothetical protein